IYCKAWINKNLSVSFKINCYLYVDTVKCKQRPLLAQSEHSLTPCQGNPTGRSGDSVDYGHKKAAPGGTAINSPVNKLILPLTRFCRCGAR
ncbi:hypothetical protein, partial [Morganella morganii]|uniref:hypothetical protein n=1 Tax=Morganella morganii TaxID=582 RepID=UPI0019572EA1